MGWSFPNAQLLCAHEFRVLNQVLVAVQMQPCCSVLLKQFALPKQASKALSDVLVCLTVNA